MRSQALETTFQQDLNGDGTTGIATTVIEAAGSTTLAQVADTFTLNGVTLKYFGAAVTDGQFGAWKPIGAAQSGGGYQVAWQFGTADQYTIWNVDGAGSYVPGHTITSGKTYAFEAAETTFQQDLNGDGTTGLVTTVIEAAGSRSTTLAQVADTFTLNGVTLKDSGAAVTDGQFCTWKPIGAERQFLGDYRVAWQFGTADQYTIWVVDHLETTTR